MDIYDNADPVLLCTLADEAETGVVLEALKEQGIPVVTKFKPGSSLTIIIGYSYQDIELYVPSRLIDAAKEILYVTTGDDKYAPKDDNSNGPPVYIDNNDFTEDAGQKIHESHIAKSLRIILYVIIIFLCIGIPLIAWLVYNLS